MTVAALIADLVSAGVSAELVGRVAAALSAREPVIVEVPKSRTAGALRQERYRERHKPSQSDGSDVTASQQKCSPTPPIKTTPSLRSVEIQRAREADLDGKFAELRKVYPRRAGGDPPKSARKAFGTAVRDGADPDNVIATARAFAETRAGEDPRFTPMLASWLNSGGHLADYSVRPPPRAGPNGRQEPGILTRLATMRHHDEPDYSPQDETAGDLLDLTCR